MKLMLTSFGIGQPDSSTSDGYSRLHLDHPPPDTHRVTHGSYQESLFHRMPPVSFSLINEWFMPDYELLVLCDQVVMDGSSFERLVNRPASPYSKVADTFQALGAEGRVELVDFAPILQSNSQLLSKMLDHDLKLLDQWVEPLRVSLNTWATFMRNFRQLMFEDRKQSHVHPLEGDEHTPRSHMMLMHEMFHAANTAEVQGEYVSFMVAEALGSSEKRKRREHREALREVLRAYLSYVNANIVLSSELEIGFHDWLDFTPFYSTKFLSVGKLTDPVQESRKQVEELFTLSFPDFAVHDTSALLKALNDKRIEELRRLVADAASGKVDFDLEFARSVLTEVFQGERRARRVRNIIGYLTLPIGFIPWIGTPAQKFIDEAVGSTIEKRIKREHRWFYMLSDIAGRHDNGTC